MSNKWNVNPTFYNRRLTTLLISVIWLIWELLPLNNMHVLIFLNLNHFRVNDLLTILKYKKYKNNLALFLMFNCWPNLSNFWQLRLIFLTQFLDNSHFSIFSFLAVWPDVVVFHQNLRIRFLGSGQNSMVVVVVGKN